MRLIGDEPCPLPAEPALAEAALALNEAGDTACIVDRRWRLVYVTHEQRLSWAAMGELEPVPLESHWMLSREAADYVLSQRAASLTLDTFRAGVAAVAPIILADTPGGREELRTLADPRFHDLLDEISPVDLSTAVTFRLPFVHAGRLVPEAYPLTLLRVRDREGRIAGTIIQLKPPVGMATLTALAAGGDVRHFERMQSVTRPGRRPAAILFADLEASSPLARKLSTASYFALARRLVRAADACIVDAGGLVGRHVGDGVVAFFLVETTGSESAAARACISAARALRETLDEVAELSDLQPGEVVLRFGLHWGSTLYVGQIATRGRTEVTALGDEVNHGARIEACATGGLALASKDLIERLDPEDAAALDLDPDRVTYTALGDLTTTTEKARRDAPAIAVCEI